MVQSADSRIQSHTFGCPLLSPDVSDHASTNPASFSPWARPQAKRCSTTKALPNHRASVWTCSSIHCLPREVRGQNKNTVPSLRTRTSGVFGTTCDELLMDACSFWSNTHQVTKTEKAPSVSGAIVETAIMPNIARPLGVVRSKPSRRLTKVMPSDSNSASEFTKCLSERPNLSNFQTRT